MYVFALRYGNSSGLPLFLESLGTRDFLPFPQFPVPLPGSLHSIVWLTELASDSQRGHLVGSYCTPVFSSPQ